MLRNTSLHLRPPRTLLQEGKRHFRSLAKKAHNGAYIEIKNPEYTPGVAIADIQTALDKVESASPKQPELRSKLCYYVKKIQRGELYTHHTTQIIESTTLTQGAPQLPGVFFTNGRFSGEISYHCSMGTHDRPMTLSFNLLAPFYTPTPTKIAKNPSEFWLQFNSTQVPFHPILVGVTKQPGKVHLYPGGPLAKSFEAIERTTNQLISKLLKHHTVVDQDHLDRLNDTIVQTMPTLRIPRHLAQCFSVIPTMWESKSVFPYSREGEFISRYLDRTLLPAPETDVYSNFRKEGDKQVFELAQSLKDPYINVTPFHSGHLLKVMAYIPPTQQKLPTHWNVFMYNTTSGLSYLGTQNVHNPHHLMQKLSEFHST